MKGILIRNEDYVQQHGDLHEIVRILNSRERTKDESNSRIESLLGDGFAEEDGSSSELLMELVE